MSISTSESTTVAFHLPLDLVTISSRWGLIDSVPAASQVTRAVRLLTIDVFSSDVKNEDVESARRVLEEFLRMFESRSRRFAMAMIIGQILGKASGVEDSNSWVRRGMGALKSLRPEWASSQPEPSDDWEVFLNEIALQIQNHCRYDLFERHSRDNKAWEFNATTPDQWKRMLDSELQRAGTWARAVDMDYEHRAWSAWYERLKPRGHSQPADSSIFAELLCATQLKAPATVFQQPLNSLRLREWSRVLVDSLNCSKPHTQRGQEDSGSYRKGENSGRTEVVAELNLDCPQWVAIPAIREIGLPRKIAEAIQGIFENEFQDYPYLRGHSAVTEQYPRSVLSADRGMGLLISDDVNGGPFADYRRNGNVSACILTSAEFEELCDNLTQAATRKVEEARTTSDGNTMNDSMKIVSALLDSFQYCAVDIETLETVPRQGESTAVRPPFLQLNPSSTTLDVGREGNVWRTEFDYWLQERKILLVKNSDRFPSLDTVPDSLEQLTILARRKLKATFDQE